MPSSGWDRSLANAIEALALHAGFSIDRDDLLAGLGLSMMVCAPSEEAPLEDWPLYARDAFLVEAGQLFGMMIRDVHPPEAARGLSGFAEFGQHFDASYKPLIRNALDNGQPVLAWRGWPGSWEKLWGEIRGPCEAGLGFHGTIITGEPRCEASLVLDRPPVQVYVVETITPCAPTPVVLLDTALSHAQRVLENVIGQRFGVVTGPKAFEAWAAKLKEPRTDDTAFVRGMAALARGIVEGHRSAERFFEQHRSLETGRACAAVEALMETFRQVVASLTDLCNETGVAERLRRHDGIAEIDARLAEAREVTTRAIRAFHAA